MYFKKIFYVVLLAVSCNKTPVQNPSIIPVLTIESHAYSIWFSDSLLEEMIYPSVSHCAPGHICSFATFGPPDYTCTIFPDTFWGIINFYMSPPDTFICYSDTARSLHGTNVFTLGEYFNHLSHALCSGSAVSYTQNDIHYAFSSTETKVRIHNSCFDTTFSSSFSLPRIPLDTCYGFWLESIDTFFCPSSFVDSLSGNFDYNLIKSFNYQL